MTKKKDLIIQEEVDRFLKRASDNNTDKSNQEQLLKLLQEIQIILDEVSFEDSIDGTRIRVNYGIEIRRKEGGGGGGGEQGENTVRFHYIKEIPIDYSKVPISFAGNANTTTHVSDNDITEDYIITESYGILEETCPTLYEILGLLKRIYFMPEDFSNRLTVERIHKLRNMFSKDEILAFPSGSLDDKAGLIPI
ncbi:MAG: hypothetical protein ACJ72X_15065 [Nitrososphaeraceae archaeon]